MYTKTHATLQGSTMLQFVQRDTMVSYSLAESPQISGKSNSVHNSLLKIQEAEHQGCTHKAAPLAGAGPLLRVEGAQADARLPLKAS